MIHRIRRKRVLRTALVCLALAFLPAIPPMSRILDNLWRSATEPSDPDTLLPDEVLLPLEGPTGGDSAETSPAASPP